MGAEFHVVVIDSITVARLEKQQDATSHEGFVFGIMLSVHSLRYYDVTTVRESSVRCILLYRSAIYAKRR